MKETVHILGGGLAGLSAAVQLIQFGMIPVIVEKNGYLGGRVRSFRDPETGDEIDNGQHLLMKAYTDTNWFLKKIGSYHLVEYQKNLEVPYKIFSDALNHSNKIFRVPGWTFPFHWLGVLFSNSFFSLSEKRFLVKSVMALKQADKNQTVAEILDKCHEPVTLRQRFWKPFVESALNTDVVHASAQLLWKTIEISLLRDGRAAALGFPRLGLSHIFAAPAEKYILEHGGRIMRRNMIKRISFTSENYVSGLVDSDGAEIPVKFLIAAVPYGQLKKICPISFLDRISKPILTSYEYSAIISAHIWLKKPLFHDSFWAVTGKTIQWLFNKRVYGGPFHSDYHLYQVTISAANEVADMNNLYVIKLIQDDLLHIFPRLCEDDIVRIKIIKEKTATPLSSPHITNHRPEIHTPVKNLFLAGDWINSDLPCTMEAAVKTGRGAAHKIISTEFWES